jgi:hypothetical protein
MKMVEITNLIESVNGLLVLGFVLPHSSICRILSERYKRTIKKSKIDCNFTEFYFNDEDKVDLQKLGVNVFPTYQFYFNGELVESFKSYISEIELFQIFNEFKDILELEL